jgi:hypothetical protein
MDHPWMAVVAGVIPKSRAAVEVVVPILPAVLPMVPGVAVVSSGVRGPSLVAGMVSSPEG